MTADPDRYLFGPRGDRTVVLPGHVAAWIYNQCQLRHVREPNDPEVASAIVALQMAALEEPTAPGSRTSRTTAPGTEVAGQLDQLNTRAAADQLGITPRAVTLAITQRRLPATKHDGRWRIDPDDLDRYNR